MGPQLTTLMKTSKTDLSEVPTGPAYKTLTGESVSIDACFTGEPHVFLVLAYAPGEVLQTVCQHCLLLTSFGLSAQSAQLSN